MLPANTAKTPSLTERPVSEACSRCIFVPYSVTAGALHSHLPKYAAAQRVYNGT